jgi:hypothetical protein
VYDSQQSGGAASPAAQDQRTAAVGSGINPFVDRINLRNVPAGSYGSAVEAVDGGEFVYFPGGR